MKNFQQIIIICLVALVLIQGAGLFLNYQEQQMLTEKLEAYETRGDSYEEKLGKVDTLLTDTGDLLEDVDALLAEVKTVIEKFSIFK